MGGTWNTNGEEVEHILIIVGKARRKEITRKTKT
jgi:hypothetical protein